MRPHAIFLKPCFGTAATTKAGLLEQQDRQVVRCKDNS